MTHPHEPEYGGEIGWDSGTHLFARQEQGWEQRAVSGRQEVSGGPEHDLGRPSQGSGSASRARPTLMPLLKLLRLAVRSNGSSVGAGP